MNARELLDRIENASTPDIGYDKEAKETICRALRLLAAAESNDGTVCKLVEDLRTEADLCRNETATDIAELLDDAASSIIAISAQFNAIKDERNGLAARVRELEDTKDGAYLERNRLVALLASMFPSGVKKTAIEGWSDDWHSCVYIDFPWGQASWHYHDSHAHLFDNLTPYRGEWDGHTTEQKYAAIDAARSKP